MPHTDSIEKNMLSVRGWFDEGTNDEWFSYCKK